jgi:ribosomal protein S3
MGHPVNPISFRLGVSRGWSFTSSSLENHHHQFFFNSQSSNVLNFFKRLFNTKVVQRLGLIFSHINVFNAFDRQDYLIFYYDGPFEAEGRFFFNILKRKIFTRKLLAVHKMLLKNIIAKRVKKLRRIVLRTTKLQILSLFFQKKNLVLSLQYSLVDTLIKIFHLLFLDNFYVNTVKKDFFSLSPDDVENNTFLIYQIFPDYINSFLTVLLEKSFLQKLKNFFQRILFKFNKTLSKLFIIKIKKIIFLRKFKIRIKFFRFFQRIIKFARNLTRRKILFFKFFVKFLRAFIFTNFFRIFLYKFKKILFPFNYKQVNFNFKCLNKTSITASIIAKYICVRLLQKYSIKQIVRPIINDLVRNRYVSGFKISCCGRFTKKEIATYFWKKIKRVSLSRATSRVDYSFKEVVLKYSICGVKVWLQSNPYFPIKRFNWKAGLDIAAKLERQKKQILRDKKKRLKRKKLEMKQLLKKNKLTKLKKKLLVKENYKKNGFISKKNKI